MTYAAILKKQQQKQRRRPMERTHSPVAARTVASAAPDKPGPATIKQAATGSIQRALKLVSQARELVRTDIEAAWGLLYEAETSLRRAVGK